MRAIRLWLAFVVMAAVVLAQPSINAVQNAASYIPAGLPNSGIAQGSMFVVKGTGLGPASVVIAKTYPLQTSIGGTSVQVTVGSRTVNAIMYYALAAQVAAILPSSTPVGTGSVTVTVNGQTSAPAPITVVQNNFGMFTISQSGTGDAIGFVGTTLLSPTAAAKPGDIVVFWGTGLGPVPDDETNAAKGGDLTNVPLEVYIGAKPAKILYRGRNACCSSVDTVYAEVPQGVAGCVTPVIMKIGNVVSNTATIPVAASGTVCTPTNFSQGDLNSLLSKGTYTVGGISLLHTVTVTPPITVGPITVPGATTRTDAGGATFFKILNTPGSAGLSSSFDIATFGACTVTTFSAGGSTPSVPGLVQYLDAGNTISVSGPSGARGMPKTTIGNLLTYFSQFDNTGTYLTAGQYTITGPSGPDVGPFTIGLNVPPPLVWTNQEATTTVNRTNGVTLNWSGGDPAGYVQITGASSTLASAVNAATAAFTCTARTSDGTFTVPPVVLLALPASPVQSVSGFSVPIPGSLSIGSFSAAVPFQAPGLDFGGAASASFSASGVVYQ